MKKKFLQYTLLCCSLIVLLSACRKDPFSGKETKESGKTFVYITEADGDPYIQFFDVFSDVKPVVLFTIRRDAANNADLQKSFSVTLTADADSTDALGLTPFTSDLYSVPSAADLASGGLYASSNGITISADGKTITVNFAPGEFNKNIIYKVDGSKLDLTQTYGGVYKVSNLGAFTGKVGYQSIGAAIAVKNAYDGVYSEAGNLVRLPADGSVDTSPLGGTIAAGKNLELITFGPTDVYIPQIWWADLSATIGGIGDVLLHIDPATNLVTVTSDANPYLGNMAGQTNSYDPGTHTFTLNFAWTSGGPGTNGRQAHLTLGYSGSR